MNINALFEPRNHCFLPVGDISSIQEIMKKDASVFWDGQWRYRDRSTRALVYFCDEYSKGYRRKRGEKNIFKPDLFMFSPPDTKHLVSQHLFYPEDVLYQDSKTAIVCRGMLPLSLKEKHGSCAQVDAQIIHVEVFDSFISQMFFVLQWLHPTPFVCTMMAAHKPSISYYWEQNFYRYQEKRTYSVDWFQKHEIPLQYYISNPCFSLSSVPFCSGESIMDYEAICAQHTQKKR